MTNQPHEEETNDVEINLGKELPRRVVLSPKAIRNIIEMNLSQEQQQELRQALRQIAKNPSLGRRLTQDELEDLGEKWRRRDSKDN